MKHPNAEVIHAIAEGKDVQWRYPNEAMWRDFHPDGIRNPFRDIHVVWRVKPEPKPDVVLYCTIFKDGNIWAEDEEVYSGKLKLTFDGEGNLKDSEVLKNG